eukprot:8237411-Pyramimonas_sp.AAC.1
MRRCTSCILCPVWTRVDYAADAFQENLIYGVRREYVYYSTILPPYTRGSISRTHQIYNGIHMFELDSAQWNLVQ